MKHVVAKVALLAAALVLLLADVSPAVSALQQKQPHVDGAGAGAGFSGNGVGRRALRAAPLLAPTPTDQMLRTLLQDTTDASATDDASAVEASPEVLTTESIDAPTTDAAVDDTTAIASEETQEVAGDAAAVAAEAQSVLDQVETETKKDEELLDEIQANKEAESLVLDNVKESQGAMGVELITMAKQLTRMEDALSRLEKYEGIRTGHKASSSSTGDSSGGGEGAGEEGAGGWFSDKSTFMAGFAQSFLVIVFIEIGDRTFFIAALMSVKHNQFIVFLGAFAALATMTVVSTIMGVAAPLFLPRWLVHWGAVVLFIFYGITMLYKAQFMSDKVSEELEEVEEELEEMSEKAKHNAKAENKPWYEGIVSPILLQAFTLTFLAEWGDRSQIATIAMGADYNAWGIIIGATLGHGVATSGACIGGRMVAKRISERTIAILGGLIFLIFGVMAIFDDPTADYASALPSWMTNVGSKN